MKLDVYQVDAFASQVFEGNPAAVCPLDEWLDDGLMQSIAFENNLAETAFFVKEGGAYRIRWFTPQTEVDLCGHATLASAYVLFRELNYAGQTVSFQSNSGPLSVVENEGRFELDFPAQVAQPCNTPAGLEDALGAEVKACYFNEDLVAVLSNESSVARLTPDFNRLSLIEARGIIATARSRDFDFVNRFFAPRVGVNEDPVTGSAFTKLVPYWAEQLSTNELHAKQLSPRGGEILCTLVADRVRLRGQAVLFLKGEIFL